MVGNFQTSGKVDIKLPGHDYRDAKYNIEQTVDSIKSKFVWDDGLEIEYVMTADKVDMKTNGKLYIEDDKHLIIRLD